MRDILNILDQIEESRGLSAREPGEVYARGPNPQDQIVFQGLTFYPESGAYADKDEMLAAFSQAQQQLGQQIQVVNTPTARTRAFGIAQFDTSVGVRYLAKFAEDIKPVRTQNKFFQTKDIPGNYSQADARGSKEKVGYKPSDVLTEFKSQTPDSILSQIAKRFGKDSDEYTAATIIASAASFPVSVPAGSMDFAGFRDYFCEMLQPIVLINGAKVKGNAAEAARTFMKGTFEDCVVSFNTNVSGGLYDSLLVNSKGKQIKLSSKGAKGAMASSVNLLRSVQELTAAGMTQFAKEYANTIHILEIIDRGDHNTGPLDLAVELGIITPAESQQVLDMKAYSGDPNFDIDQARVSSNLKKIYRERTAEDPSKIIPINHMVASIAYKVCNQINTQTDFSEAAADILNNSAFVQMYTEAKKSGDQFIINGFNTVWPSKLFHEVTLEAQKSYSSTASSGGKLVFNINKEPKAVANQDNSGVAAADSGGGLGGDDVDLDAVTHKRSAVRAATKPEKLGTEKSLGRRRQR